MDLFISILRGFGEFGGAVTFAGALLALIFRERLVSVLTARTSRSLEDRKGEIQRELEAYKVSLIAEAERAKAAAEVKKAAAMKLAALKLDRFTDYFIKSNELLSHVAALLSITRTQQTYNECYTTLNVVRLAYQQVSPFLEPAQVATCIKGWQAVSALVEAHGKLEQPALDTENSLLYTQALAANTVWQATLRKQIDQLTAI